MEPHAEKKKGRPPTFVIALVPLFGLIGFLHYLVDIRGYDPHYALIAAAILAAMLALACCRTSWRMIEEGILDSSYAGFRGIIFFLLAILLNGFWLRSGILPTLVYYGGKFLTPSLFPYITLGLFALVSFATGSSWVSVGMLGPSFMTIAALLGQPQAMAAGIILSGAFWGSRLSPLSLSNYLSVSVTGARLADHIKHSLVTAIPALVAVLASLISFEPQWRSASGGKEIFLADLARLFSINPLLLFFPVLFIILLTLRVSAVPVFSLGVLTGSILIVFYQQEPARTLMSVAGSGSPALMESLGSQGQTYWAILDKGGVQDQWWVVGLILCAFVFGGVMKTSGLLEALPKAFVGAASTKRTLGVLAVLSSIFVNLASPDHYLSIVLPARFARTPMAKTDMEPEDLSRSLADTGPPTAALVPWSMTGIVMAALLGVEAGAYTPWAVYNWVSPLLAILFALLGIFPSRDSKSARKPGKEQGLFSL
ncbi:MAG TPA: Na+/H+ antiporter NhaC family protein [Bacillota bacterium]|nr:hypothetical protein [Fastidiosipila sp.]HPX93453.1 Na+/H+ antiporter NhaC family protein [Bacillota bacterium]HQB81224.1 Na+/H+ antiporter NhaC family protein [Bacillota bacterium]